MVKALVIDDEKAFTDIAERFLSGFCQVKVAVSAEDGLNALNDFQADIVVVDNQLPGINGVDLVRKIRSLRAKDVCIAMVTIDKEEDVAAALIPEKVDIFLKKPFRRSDLEKILLEAILAVRRKKGAGL
jgi:DNA-binding response OmpR family regulator